MRYGSLAKLGYADWKLGAALTGYQVTLSLREMTLFASSLNFFKLRLCNLSTVIKP